MTKRSEKIPTATERIAEQVRSSRTAGGWDQSTVAALVTALGSPTNTSTVTRIESGDQPPTVEQVLLLALTVRDGGLRALLVPPFTIGTMTVATEADLDVLLLGGEPSDLDTQAAERTKTLWDDRRHKMIADSLGTTPAKVGNAAQRLYGHGADAEISARFKARLAEVTPTPEPETGPWRAYRSHAVRAVTKEIGENLR